MVLEISPESGRFRYCSSCVFSECGGSGNKCLIAAAVKLSFSRQDLAMLNTKQFKRNLTIIEQVDFNGYSEFD